MSKILITFFSNLRDSSGRQLIPCFYESFIDGLIKNGNDVLVIRHKYFNRDFEVDCDLRVKKVIEKFKPDLAFIFNNSFYDLSFYDFPLVIFDVDSPRYFSNKSKIKDAPYRYKFITTQKTSVNTLKSEYGIKTDSILHIPFFTSIQNVPMEKKHNICFIGTRFPTRDVSGMTSWNKFMLTRPTLYKKKQFKELVNAIQSFPSKAQQIIENFKLKGLNCGFLENDDVVMGLSGAKRELILSQVSDLDLVIYGQNEWILDSSPDIDLVLSYDANPIASVLDNQNVYNSSKIGLNINHVQAESGFSWRVMDIMASGACLVTEYNKRIDDLFHDVEIPFFYNRFEARQVCNMILNDESRRADIVSCCNDIIDKKYRFKNIVVPIEDFVGTKLTCESFNNTERNGELYLLNLEVFL